MKCPYCDSVKNHLHDAYCDDEHAPGDCYAFYCDECGQGFDEGEVS